MMKIVGMDPPQLGPAAAASGPLASPSGSWLASFVIPPWFAKTSANLALQHSNRLVKYFALNALYICFMKLAAVLAELDKLSDSSAADTAVAESRVADDEDAQAAAAVSVDTVDGRAVRNELLSAIRKRLPDLQILLALLPALRPTAAQPEDDAAPNASLAYQRLLSILASYQRFAPDLFIESRYDFGKLLPETAAALEQFSPAVQYQLCRVLQAAPVSSWVKGGNGEALRGLVQLYCHTPHDAVRVALERLLVGVLLGTQLFEHHPTEALLWVHALRRADSSAVNAFFERCVAEGNATVYRYLDQAAELMQNLRDETDPADAWRSFVLGRAWAVFSPFALCAWEMLQKQTGDEVQQYVAGVVASMRTTLEPSKWLFEPLLTDKAHAALWKIIFCGKDLSIGGGFNAAVEQQCIESDAKAGRDIILRASRLSALEAEHALFQAARLLANDRKRDSAFIGRLWQALLARLRRTATRQRFQTVAAAVFLHPHFADTDALVEQGGELVFAMTELALAGLLPTSLADALRVAVAKRATAPDASSQSLGLAAVWTSLLTQSERASLVNALLSRLISATTGGDGATQQVLACLLHLLSSEEGADIALSASQLSTSTVSRLLTYFEESPHEAVTRAVSALYAWRPRVVVSASSGRPEDSVAAAAPQLVAGCLAHPSSERLVLLGAFLLAGGDAARGALVDCKSSAMSGVPAADQLALLAVAAWSASGGGRPQGAADVAALKQCASLKELVNAAFRSASRQWCTDVADAAAVDKSLAKRVRAAVAAHNAEALALPPWGAVLLSPAWRHTDDEGDVLDADTLLKNSAPSSFTAMDALETTATPTAWLAFLLTAGAALVPQGDDYTELDALLRLQARALAWDGVHDVLADEATQQLCTLARTAMRSLDGGRAPSSSLCDWCAAVGRLFSVLRGRGRVRTSLAAWLLEQPVARFYLAASCPLREPLAILLSALVASEGHEKWATPFHAAAVLRAYHGTTDAADRHLLKALIYWDTRPRESSLPKGGFSMLHVGIQTDDDASTETPAALYEPSLRDAVPEAPSTDLDLARSALLQSVRPLRMTRAILAFDPSGESPEHSRAAYDADFFIPLTMQVLLGARPGVSHDSNLRRFVECNWAGMLVVSLSSVQPRVRKGACAALAALRYALLYSRVREASQLIVLLDAVKNALELDAETKTVPAIPFVVAYFVAQALPVMLKPDHPMYPLINRFLLQRPVLDLDDIPMFYSLFYDSGDQFRTSRLWVTRTLLHGLKDARDWRLYRRRHVVDVLTTLHDSGNADAPMRRLVLACVERALELPAAGADLVRRAGMLAWLTNLCALPSNSTGKDASAASSKASLASLIVIARAMRTAARFLAGQSAPAIASLCAAAVAALVRVIDGVGGVAHAHRPLAALLFAEAAQSVEFIARRFLWRKPVDEAQLACIMDKWAAVGRWRLPETFTWDEDALLARPTAAAAARELLLCANSAVLAIAMSSPALLSERSLSFAASLVLGGAHTAMAGDFGEWVVSGACAPTATVKPTAALLATLFGAVTQAVLAPGDAQPRAVFRLLCGALVIGQRAGLRVENAPFEAPLALISKSTKGSEIKGVMAAEMMTCVVRALCFKPVLQRAMKEKAATPSKRRKTINGDA